MGKQARADQANKLIEAIASCGRRFFHHAGVISGFSVDHRGRIWFIDGYSKKRIYTQHKGRWRGFTEGGTLRSLVEQLANFIRTGEMPKLGLGPWPEWYCGGDLWAYGDDMQKVRDAALELGLTARTPDTGGGHE